MQLYCMRLATLHGRGALDDTVASLAKLNNTSKGRQICLDARDLLGGNGILLDNHVMRHLADLEATHTYGLLTAGPTASGCRYSRQQAP